MHNNFPTFEEIEQGYQVFDIQGRYLGEDEYGNPRFAKPFRQELRITNYTKYLVVYILLNKRREREAFIFGYCCKRYSYEFPYSKEGYARMLKQIIENLKFDEQCIQMLIKNAESRELENQIKLQDNDSPNRDNC